MALAKVQGIVLKGINLGESDKIITVYTDVFGKIDIVAHGSRKPKSKFMASTQPFCYSEYVIFKGKNLYTLSDSMIIDSFQIILQDLEKLSYGSYFLELTDALNEKENKNVSILALLLKTMYLLVHDEIDIKLLRFAFDFKAISLSGYMPQINYCIKCRKKIEEVCYFNIPEGGAVCEDCMRQRSSFKLAKDEIELMQKIKLIKLEELRNIKYNDKSLSIIQSILLNYLQYHTGREFKSLSLLDKV